MPSTKDLLLKQTREAFGGAEWMSLKGAVEDLTPEEASWRLNDKTWTIEEILYHVAQAKARYSRQAFKVGPEELQSPIGELAKGIALLEETHARLEQCLVNVSEEDLDRPVETKLHGESAANLFWIMIVHDLSHASQIRTIRRAYGSRTDFYPIQ